VHLTDNALVIIYRVITGLAILGWALVFFFSRKRLKRSPDNRTKVVSYVAVTVIIAGFLLALSKK
jgi:multisubunit Na+/H+ antiporter MnhF subunit